MLGQHQVGALTMISRTILPRRSSRLGWRRRSCRGARWGTLIDAASMRWNLIVRPFPRTDGGPASPPHEKVVARLQDLTLLTLCSPRKAFKRVWGKFRATVLNLAAGYPRQILG